MDNEEMIELLNKYIKLNDDIRRLRVKMDIIRNDLQILKMIDDISKGR